MPAKDIYHNTVRNALIKDGWTIIYDPLGIKIAPRDLYIDLGAEKQIDNTIAVEIKSFLGNSPVVDLEKALGQYILYQTHLKIISPQRKLYLAIATATMMGIFSETIGQVLIEDKIIKLLVFDSKREVITQWIH